MNAGSTASDPAIFFDAVDIVFGDRPQAALPAIDEGLDRAAILERTGQVIGVAGATLAVERGEICVLMGLSGSGKSTLLRAVNRLARPTRGRVTVTDGGRPVVMNECDRATLARMRTRRIAMVFQQFALLPWRSVEENVGLGLEMRGMRKAEAAARARDRLALVGLAECARMPVDALSGGMQQRVGLARALATDADILLMDEPFSALDPLIRERLQDELLDLQRQLHKTIVFVSHDLDEAIRLGNRIAIMQDGRIVQHGTAEEIVLRPASAYVRDFVARVNPLRVLTAASMMHPPAGRPLPDSARALRPGSVAEPPAGPLLCRPGTPMQALLDQAAAGHGPFLVEDAAGNIAGIVERDDLLAVLATGGRATNERP